jgi:hypothetical protein
MTPIYGAVSRLLVYDEEYTEVMPSMGEELAIYLPETVNSTI